MGRGRRGSGERVGLKVPQKPWPSGDQIPPLSQTDFRNHHAEALEILMNHQPRPATNQGAVLLVFTTRWRGQWLTTNNLGPP